MEIQPVHPKGSQSWIFIGKTDAGYFAPILQDWCSNTLATWPCCWERLKARGERDDRGWDNWTASLTQCTWVWVSSRSWWWTGRPGVLQFMGSQRVWHDWVTELIPRVFFFFKFKIFSPNFSLCLLYPCLRKRHLELLYVFDYHSCNWKAPLPTFSEGSP